MEASITITDFNNALKRVSSSVVSDTITLKEKNKRLQLVSGTKESYLSLQVANSEVDKGFLCTLNRQILSGILKNRKGTLSFSLNKKQHSVSFVCSDKGYKGDLTCVPDNVEELKLPEAQSSISIPGNLQSDLSSMLKTAMLHDALDNKELDLHISLSPKGTTVSAFDAVHVARFMSKIGTKKTTEFTILGSVFRLIADIANSKKYMLHFTGGQVFAVNEEFVFSAALIQNPASVTKEQVESLIKGLPKATTSFTVDLKAFYECMENIIAIHEAKGSVDVVVSKGKLRLRNSSNFGKIEDVVKAKVEGKDGEYSLDPHLLDDVIQCIGAKEVTFNLVPKKFIFLQCKSKLGKATYVINLV